MLVKACTNGLGYKWFINISILLSQLKIYIGLLYYKHIAMLPQEILLIANAFLNIMMLIQVYYALTASILCTQHKCIMHTIQVHLMFS